MVFDDIYFSPENGLAETQHVFLGGNDIASRIQHATTFTIAELGFGTSLNFLATLQIWRQHAPQGATLHYHTIEKYPLDKATLQKALMPWQELEQEKIALLDVYPEEVSQSLKLCFHTIQLYVHIGDVEDQLAQQNFSADAWYLDGFAPSKNPQMWAPKVMWHVGRLTKPGGTAATFTVARLVRDGLQNAGFKLEKRPGFGKKREMLTAQKAP